MSNLTHKYIQITNFSNHNKFKKMNICFLKTQFIISPTLTTLPVTNFVSQEKNRLRKGLILKNPKNTVAFLYYR